MISKFPEAKTRTTSDVTPYPHCCAEHARYLCGATGLVPYPSVSSCAAGKGTLLENGVECFVLSITLGPPRPSSGIRCLIST